MNKKNKLLTLPNWLLFILAIIPASFPNNETGEYLQVFYFFLVLIWVIKVNEELFIRIKGRPSINLNLLMAGLIISFFYVTVSILFTNGYSISADKDNYAGYGWRMYIDIPGFIITFASYLYALHFTAYSIHVLDDQLFGKRTDYGILLAALFLYPFGIWWVQPKIIRLLAVPLDEKCI